jgi:hypothetical protein
MSANPYEVGDHVILGSGVLVELRGKHGTVIEVKGRECLVEVEKKHRGWFYSYDCNPDPYRYKVQLADEATIADGSVGPESECDWCHGRKPDHDSRCPFQPCADSSEPERVSVDAFLLKELIHCADAYAGTEVRRIGRKVRDDARPLRADSPTMMAVGGGKTTLMLRAAFEAAKNGEICIIAQKSGADITVGPTSRLTEKCPETRDVSTDSDGVKWVRIRSDSLDELLEMLKEKS